MKQLVLLSLVVAVATVLSAAKPASAEGKPKGAVSEEYLNKRFKDGWAIWDYTPSGKTFKVTFHPGGKLHGETHKDSDNGKWWIKGDTLCRNWTYWAPREGKEEACFWIVLEKNQVSYYEMDGEWYRDWRPWPGGKYKKFVN